MKGKCLPLLALLPPLHTLACPVKFPNPNVPVVFFLHRPRIARSHWETSLPQVPQAHAGSLLREGGAPPRWTGNVAGVPTISRARPAHAAQESGGSGGVRSPRLASPSARGYTHRVVSNPAPPFPSSPSPEAARPAHGHPATATTCTRPIAELQRLASEPEPDIPVPKRLEKRGDIWLAAPQDLPAPGAADHRPAASARSGQGAASTSARSVRLEFLTRLYLSTS
jgi:hypothetical protein